MVPKRFTARCLVVIAVELIFLWHKFDLFEFEDAGNMGESFVYKFEGFYLHIISDRGDYLARLTPDPPTHIWNLSLILEYLGIIKGPKGFAGRSSLFPMVKELWLLSRNIAGVRELFEEGNLDHAKSKLDKLKARN